MTLEELMKSDPELVKQIQNDAAQAEQAKNQAAVDDAVKAEVERLKSIDAIASKIADKELVEKAKYGEEKMSAGDLALEALKAQQDIGAQFLNNMQKDAGDSGAADVNSAPQNGSDADQAKNDIDAGAALIAGLVADNK